MASNTMIDLSEIRMDGSRVAGLARWYLVLLGYKGH